MYNFYLLNWELLPLFPDNGSLPFMNNAGLVNEV